MGLGALLYFYRRRLRVHAVQELLAGLGVATAVALVFAVIVANDSIAGSAGQIVRAFVGPANLQLRARTSDGFGEGVLERVQLLPGIKQSAPVLEVPATIVGPDGRHITVGIAGARPSLALMDGLGHTLPFTTLAAGEIGLSRATAEKIGVSSPGGSAASGDSQSVVVQMRGRVANQRVAAVLGAGDAGALSQAQVAIMPLTRLQRLAGLPGRITRVLVQTQPGRRAQVRSELRALAGGRLDVEPADADVALLDQALKPGNQASAFFAAIAVLLGFLLALDAMLLTVPERRLAIVDMRLLGAGRAAVWRMVVFQALCLGLIASLVGLGVGYALALGVLHQSGAYLDAAFTLGSETIVGAGPLLLALACGVLATLVAGVAPLLDLLRSKRALDPTARETERASSAGALGHGVRARLALGVLALMALSSLVFVLLPGQSLPVGAGLALTCVLAVPLLFGLLVGCARTLLEARPRLGTLALALASLRAVTLRSLALAATGAVALFGGVALGGATSDLLSGIEGFGHAYVSSAAVWVQNPEDHQGVEDFPAAHAIAKIAQTPGVAHVEVYQGGFVTLDGRRVWITVRPPGASRAILDSELVAGSPARAETLLDRSGWIVLSEQIASEHHLRIGRRLTLPTPTGPHAYKIAGLSTNFGWSPGSIVMSSATYERAWRTSTPTALGISLARGASPAEVRDAVARALGPASGLQVLTAGQRQAEIDAFVGEGLSRLREITTLLLLGAILALATALVSSIRQRRRMLAELRLAGATPERLRGIVMIETALTLGAGCLAGALVGIYGEVLIDRSLAHITGFPVTSLTAGLRPLELFALVMAAVLAIVAIPGQRAARVSPSVALSE
jgi:putative ABC transport system permease protein